MTCYLFLHVIEARCAGPISYSWPCYCGREEFQWQLNEVVMNSEEQTLIDGLFTKLKDAETASAPRDAAAEARIKEHLTRQPAAPYYMTQAILVQEAAVNQLNQQVKQRDEQIQQLQAELQQAKGQSSAPASGGFLSSIFGSSASRAPQPQQGQPSGGGWRDGAGFNPAPAPAAPQGGYAAPAAAAAGSGFLGGALKTAAGVAGGVLLAEGISSMFSHHSQPQEIVEVIHDAPPVQDTSSSSDQGGWGQPDQQYTADDSFDNGGDMFSDDDDSFV
ncbi:putative periplasmic ligand-binding sensor protein [Pseudomonas tremae]|uniref:Periplasmic ligand-binding sensor protein n=3 Tax=Pseudomonas syringae group TaxID=136849 RepID=A0AA40TUY7_9PSED|nr:putative periplasmic ligand-binding sensor protein [Pseudomonas coronafaciens pv. garcae]KPY03792.1 putative periplasmic ligand-binding sensor protein [Pseudomonas coronafaciens pv. oryzae]KPY25619.1 putative periplasmic ligand-binding sensor protein [Pseudomonas coronafaciens pv. porri]KPZ00750.1 putative periplasmic ligand-binding sensor protein [Pseudomonas tremae]RMN34422.1 putative periplasmic ligand-binding sensor protein [Pseudomonas coronafaciens pv. zizaniae]RMV08661.1 putative per